MENSTISNFKPIFWFCVGLGAAVFTYLFAVSFIEVPKANVPWVNTIVPFLLGGALGSIIGFLLNGTPQVPKKADTGNNTASITASITAEQKPTDTPEIKS